MKASSELLTKMAPRRNWFQGGDVVNGGGRKIVVIVNMMETKLELYVLYVIVVWPLHVGVSKMASTAHDRLANSPVAFEMSMNSTTHHRFKQRRYLQPSTAQQLPCPRPNRQQKQLRALLSLLPR
jgi:hypothetical protein